MKTKNIEEMTTWEELKKQFAEEDAKKNFKNWINNKFPNGYAGYNIYYLMLHPWKILEYWKNQVKYALQRVFRGWDDRAVWSIDYYIADLIVKLLTQLKNHHYGIPIDMFDGLSYEDENKCAYSEKDQKIADERWCNILQEIIDGFDEYVYNDVNYDCYKSEKFEKSFELFKKHFIKFWD